MFKFVVLYLGFLKHIPLLGWTYDGFLFMHTAIFNRKVLVVMEDIEEQVRSWEGVTVSMHKYGGVQYNFQNKEIGHIHSNGLVDVLFPLSIKKELVQQGKAKEHHIFKKSGWVSFYIKEEADKKNALELLRYSYDRRKNLNY